MCGVVVLLGVIGGLIGYAQGGDARHVAGGVALGMLLAICLSGIANSEEE
jgi:uncharacterized membrane protein (UPF0136 family)